MKKMLLTLSIVFMTISMSYAQFRASLGYELSLPSNQMALNIGAIHNFKIEGLVKMPHNRWAFGMDLGIGGYGSKRDPIVFTQGNTTTNTFVNVTNMVYSFKGLAQADLFSENKKFMPYFHSGFGMTFFSTELRVDDPQDVDACRPLQQETLKSDQTWLASAGLGVRWQPNTGCGSFYLDLRATQNLGGNLSYMSLNPPTGATHNHANNGGFDGTPVNVNFVNTQNNLIHQHRVGTIYNSAVSYWGLQLQFGLRF
ncbi:MAG: hypothetical protein EAZ85_02080 [Bacteroidetes bacterium]|nr:MAG: hypothetical protein EAZ85_02080 [Bacteroidota bacterium]TAG86932.1 MAG: hypothetical protein EAZ20_11775 [Bacteroidota bacterium]